VCAHAHSPYTEAIRHDRTETGGYVGVYSQVDSIIQTCNALCILETSRGQQFTPT
jgi:hypothetical protein